MWEIQTSCSQTHGNHTRNHPHTHHTRLFSSVSLSPHETSPTSQIYFIINPGKGGKRGRGGKNQQVKMRNRRNWAMSRDPPPRLGPLWLHLHGGSRTLLGTWLPGHLEVLKWLCEQKCPWDHELCSQAAMGDYLVALKWLRGTDTVCPWGEMTR